MHQILADRQPAWATAQSTYPLLKNSPAARVHVSGVRDGFRRTEPTNGVNSVLSVKAELVQLRASGPRRSVVRALGWVR